jgi:hypothetical protein
VTELPSDGPSIHEILQRLESDHLKENAMDAIGAKRELNPLSWTEIQESNMLDTVYARTSNDSTMDSKTETSTFVGTTSTQATMLTPILTPLADVPVHDFNSSGAIFSTAPFPTTGFSVSPSQSKGSPTSNANSIGEVYLPPWTFNRQQIDNFTPGDSTGFGQLHLS